MLFFSPRPGPSAHARSDRRLACRVPSGDRRAACRYVAALPGCDVRSGFEGRTSAPINGEFTGEETVRHVSNVPLVGTLETCPTGPGQSHLDRLTQFLA